MVDIGETHNGRGATSVTPAVNEAVKVRPTGALAPCVAWYSGYRQAGIAPALQPGMPSPYLTLIFTLDDPLTMAAHSDPRQAPGDYDALIGGLHSTPALISHEGRQSGIQLALNPLGARLLLGLPAGELADIDLHAHEVLGSVCGQIQERLRSAADWPQRFAVLNEVLVGTVRPYGSVPPEVARAWQMLNRSGGTIPMSALADEVGWSGRHLASRFNTEIGLSPKAAARVIRFHRARRLMAADKTTRLADLAVRCGYFDQAHLAREFRAMAGRAPSAWLTETSQ